MQTFSIDHLRKIGHSYLRSNQIAKALEVYGQILAFAPDDVDSLLVLGDALLVAEERDAARQVYLQANRYAPEHQEVKKRLKILNIEAMPGEYVQIQSISGLVETITGKLVQPGRDVSDDEIESARGLLNEILNSDSPAEAVAENLERIEALIPALIEVNLRQAKSEGNMGLASSLEKIKGEIFHQQEDEPDPPERLIPHRSTRRTISKILVTGVSSLENPFRQRVIAKGLRQSGFEVVESGDDEWMSWEPFDLAIVQNPHANHQMMRDLAACYASGKPVIVDFTVDFELLPVSHPEANRFGLKNQEIRRRYNAAIHLASAITVCNAEFAANLIKSGLPAHFLPDSWDQGNPLWEEPGKIRNTFNIGLACLPYQEEDVMEIRRSIARVMREFPHTRLVMSGDLNVYQLFDSVSDDRKLFLPQMSGDEYPFMFTHMDTILMPLRDTYYNQLRSDRRLMEAGIRKIPWISTNLRMVTSWGSGGLISHTPEDWYMHLRSLILDETLRTKLGQEGFDKAQERSAEVSGIRWQKLFSDVLSQLEAH